MTPIRLQATAEADGELHLRDLPIQKGQQAEVIVLTEQSTDDALEKRLRVVGSCQPYCHPESL